MGVFNYDFLYSQLFITPSYPTASFTNQTIIVTGSNVGLGLEAARHFTRLGAAKVILAVRNPTAGEEALQSIEKSTGTTGICEIWDLDLASHESVLAFGKKVAQLPRLDVFVANASIATSTFQLAEGHERTITVNVINTMLLALLVLPTLRKSARLHPGTKPRLTTVVSEVHAWTNFAERSAESVFKALDDKERANMLERYETSKLLQVLLLREMVAQGAGDSVVINMVNPGFCHSRLGREMGLMFTLLKIVFARSTEVGSRTLVAGAASGEESHGAYMTNGKVNNTALSLFVRSEEGKKTQIKLWGELVEILEAIEPGCTRVV
ncbi:putative short-chain dehydrogenase/reductase family protein [Aspergillus bombycis]|uniref:Putative short-chain dehydrogenase/reductase family protein n=1 Tax=Aspergillus bombycis TaxID=109264 RepID=A0A1F8A045_9EURO|nr:putative short-chain dehydrogenase/reductase family protein [Aspergillus bombycis]OGM44715.1 putative short-chain dehydrogenase/reductase family protein [Aspergillus bombycis]